MDEQIKYNRISFLANVVLFIGVIIASSFAIKYFYILNNCTNNQIKKDGIIKEITYNFSKEDVVVEMNKRRAEVNAKPLKENELMDKAAQMKAREMIDKDYFGHSKDGLWTYKILGFPKGWKEISENLAMGYMTSKDVIQGWMDSTEGHREAMLNPKYDEIGVAVEFGLTNQGWPRPIVVAHFVDNK